MCQSSRKLWFGRWIFSFESGKKQAILCEGKGKLWFTISVLRQEVYAKWPPSAEREEWYWKWHWNRYLGKTRQFQNPSIGRESMWGK